MMYWDIFDLVRKVILTGLIMFVDTQDGSRKILRLIVAVVFSTFYTCVLLHANPYKRRDDQNLAFISNFALICFFTMGIVIQQCDEDEMCHDLIGLSLDSYRASILAVILILSMLVT